MIVIVLVFIVCETPAALNQILYYVFSKTLRESQCTHYVRFYNICNLLVVLNSSLNFVIYCFFRRRFQQQLVDLCFSAVDLARDQGEEEAGGRLAGMGTACETSFVDHHRLRINVDLDTADSSGTASRANIAAASRDSGANFSRLRSRKNRHIATCHCTLKCPHCHWLAIHSNFRLVFHVIFRGVQA
jgi:hypothetical protein